MSILPHAPRYTLQVRLYFVRGSAVDPVGQIAATVRIMGRRRTFFETISMLKSRRGISNFSTMVKRILGKSTKGDARLDNSMFEK